MRRFGCLRVLTANHMLEGRYVHINEQAPSRSIVTKLFAGERPLQFVYEAGHASLLPILLAALPVLLVALLVALPPQVREVASIPPIVDVPLSGVHVRPLSFLWGLLQKPLGAKPGYGLMSYVRCTDRRS